MSRACRGHVVFTCSIGSESAAAFSHSPQNPSNYSATAMSQRGYRWQRLPNCLWTLRDTISSKCRNKTRQGWVLHTTVRTLASLSRGALARSRSMCAEAGTRAAAPFPAPLSPLAASLLRYASDRFLLTKPNTSCTIEVPASLRSDGVRDHSGMPFGFLSE